MKIAHHEIGRRPFVIGEAAFNHCGSVENAFKMVGAAKIAGCDAVKFQTYRTEDFCQPDDPMFPHFKRGELPRGEWVHLKRECDRLGIIFLSTPQNTTDLELLLEVGMPAIKVGSDDLANIPLLMMYAKAKLPMILSCGMATQDEIERALAVAYDPAILVCTSQYPCPPEEANLGRITRLSANFPHPVGFSDHTGGLTAAVAATAFGASILETHFTLDRTLPGPDHSWALLPDGLAHWVAAIRTTHTMLGTGDIDPSPRELEQRAKYQRRAGNQLRGS